MEPVNLCPQSLSSSSALRDLDYLPRLVGKDANHPAEETEQMGQAALDVAIGRRREDVAKEIVLGRDQNTMFGQVVLSLNRNPLVADLGLTDRPSSVHHGLTALIPLDECILAIVWELLDQPEYHSILSLFDGSSETALPNFAILLRSAALYQAKLESVCIPTATCTPARAEAHSERIHINLLPSPSSVFTSPLRHCELNALPVAIMPLAIVAATGHHKPVRFRMSQTSIPPCSGTPNNYPQFSSRRKTCGARRGGYLHSTASSFKVSCANYC